MAHQAGGRILGYTLRVKNGDAMKRFYGETLGVPETAGLELVHEPRAPLRPYPCVGLYHVAWLLPSREALAGLLKRLIELGVEFEGFSDHGVSEAVYLRDPEGNGIELYRDRPKSEWPMEHGELEMFTQPLQVRELLRLAPEGRPMDPAARVGHVHFHVSHLGAAEEFYRQRLGLDVVTRKYPGALFLSWEGYHHHLGLNTWAGTKKAPEGATGLISMTLAPPTPVADPSLVDPDGVAIRLSPETRS